MDPEINPSDYTILIVDDIHANVLLLQAILKHNQYKTITANSGLECLKKLQEEKPDLLLLDIMMPGMNGYEVAQRAKQNPDTKDIPIIFVTALNDPTHIVEGFKNGCNDYVSKPFNREEILTRISHQLSLVASKRIILRQTEELQDAIKGRDRLYSVIAHDLRSPLGSMKMALNMLIESINPDDIGGDLYEILSSADETAEELFTLLDNLLKWTKSRLGKLNVVFQDIDFYQIIAGVVDIMSPIASLNHITIKLGSECSAIVNADIDMVKTILRNLIINAIKFSHDGDSIDVNTYIDGNNAVCEVVDHGMGISEEHQEILRNEMSLTTQGARQEEGSGLGLQLCREFVLRNHGQFWFKSVYEQGSTFYFSFPIVSSEQVQGITAQSEESAQ